jgi:DNA-binding transcriptional MerR regulator
MYSIKAVSQGTGLSIETLRAWERRYSIVTPERDHNGRRSYHPEDVIRLRKLREATDAGHAISKLSRLSAAELSHLLQAPERSGAQPTARRNFGEQIIAAAEAYAPDQCDQAIAMALALLPMEEVVNQVLSPLLVVIGERWQAGTFTIGQERLITSAIRKQVSSVLATYHRIADGPIILLTTVANERHELGILLCALIGASRGLRCQYLGPDLPAADIALLADKIGAAVVGLGFALQADPAPPLRELCEVAARLPAAVELWIGGAGLRQFPAHALPARCRPLPDLLDFERQVEMLIGQRG